MEPQNITTQSSQTVSKEFKKSKAVIVFCCIFAISNIPILFMQEDLFEFPVYNYIINILQLVAFVGSLLVIFTKNKLIYKIGLSFIIVYILIMFSFIARIGISWTD